ncbi:unnamed protein product [Acanthoscelides obtectus]|uniref:Uncharacterized protein n=1 Tax=Acanthoscelides obtectus TaxID=200917 RepID=A0A9P0PPS8_ACAOB|nr:unnamed protein product [Acanthoscelides obtectus]CAK1662399.1 hypothetical protein AOBTE_LOCUS23124 [Acanthoscelides obtectus]
MTLVNWYNIHNIRERLNTDKDGLTSSTSSIIRILAWEKSQLKKLLKGNRLQKIEQNDKTFRYNPPYKQAKTNARTNIPKMCQLVIFVN